MSYGSIDCFDETNTYYNNDGTKIVDWHNSYAVVPYSIAQNNKFAEKGIPYVKVHLDISHLSHLEFDNYGEVSAMSAEIQLQKDIKDMQKVLTDIQCGLSRIEANQTVNKEEIDRLRESTEDLPAIRNDMKTLKESLVGWKHYILSPVITGVVVGLFLLIIKLVFHVQ